MGEAFGSSANGSDPQTDPNPYKPLASSERPEPEIREDWSSPQRVLFLLAAVLALFGPGLCVIAVANGVFSLVLLPPDIESVLMSATLFVTVVQLLSYAAWVLVSQELSGRQRLAWIAVLVFLNILAIPMFLFAKYRRDTVLRLRRERL